MSATAVINWTNASGSAQELFYGKDLLVTGLPGVGSGWTPSPNNPLGSSVGTQTISGLDDNVKYKFLVKGDCTNSQNIYSQSTALKWVCGAIQTPGPQLGVLSYVLQVDPSVSNSGSPISSIEVQLIGVDRTNFGVIYQTKVYSAPYSSSYTDQFNNVNGDVDWTLRAVYKTGSYPSIEIHECSSQVYATTANPGTSYIQVRNALVDGVLSQLTLGITPQLSSTLDPGYAAKVDITSLLVGGSMQQPYCTLNTIPLGTQLFARQIREDAQLTGGLFTYIGTNSPISSVPWSLQNGDIIEITPAFVNAYIFRQPIITKNAGGYDLSLKVDVPLGSVSSYTIHFTAYDYSSGATENLTATLSIAQGDTEASVVHVNTTLTTDQYSKATISSLCLTADSGISYPQSYSCPS